MTDRSSLQVKIQKLPPWLIIAIFLGLVVVSWWQTSSPPAAPRSETAKPQDSSQATQGDESRQPIPVQITPEPDTTSAVRTARSTRKAESAGESLPKTNPQQADQPKTRIENQTIRDQDGHVIFSGTIELQPTLDRIAKGDRNSHRNDGTVFQNRERRLPAKPSGYYKEYVHPTPKLGGPGPQRVIIGADGDAWYTPDHYKTFVKIREKSSP